MFVLPSKQWSPGNQITRISQDLCRPQLQRSAHFSSSARSSSRVAPAAPKNLNGGLWVEILGWCRELPWTSSNGRGLGELTWINHNYPKIVVTWILIVGKEGFKKTISFKCARPQNGGQIEFDLFHNEFVASNKNQTASFNNQAYTIYGGTVTHCRITVDRKEPFKTWHKPMNLYIVLCVHSNYITWVCLKIGSTRENLMMPQWIYAYVIFRHTQFLQQLQK